MREINKNSEISKIQKIDLRTDKVEKSGPQFCGESEELTLKEETKDFSNPTAEVLGRSQVNKTDNLKEDVAFGAKHPEVIESADKFFNIAYEQLLKNNDPNAYEKASSMATIYAKEFI